MSTLALLSIVYQLSQPLPILAASDPREARQPAAPVLSNGFLPERGKVWFDRPGDGALWAMGDTYKVRFDGDGTVYVPFFGADSESARPIRLRLEALRVGAVDLPFDASAEPKHAGTRVEVDRRTLIEAYELAPDQIEQTFVLHRPIGPGDLVVRIALATDLTIGTDAAGLRFAANAHSWVGYTRAVSVDAAGRRTPLDTEIVSGAIELRVPAEVLARARYPLTIDPVVKTFLTTAPGSKPVREPDLAYDLANDEYLLVFERRYSSTDTDVYAVTVDRDGNSIGGRATWIDLTTDNWERPRVANNAATRRFLVVAEVHVAGVSAGRISGRVRDAGGTGMGTQFAISPLAGPTLDNTRPDVGGDPAPVGPTSWLVVWTLTFNTDAYVRGWLVDGATGAPTTPLWVDNTPGISATHPVVADSNGIGAANDRAWLVAYGLAGPAPADIRAARVAVTSNLLTQPFLVGKVGSGPFNVRPMPAVSSRTAPGSGEPRHWMVVENDRGWLVRDDAFPTVVASAIDLRALDGSPPALSVQRTEWRVETDGCRFTLAYREWGPGNVSNVYASTFHLNGSALGVTEARAHLANYSGIDSGQALVANRSGGGRGLRYAAAWPGNAFGISIIGGAILDAMSPGGGYTVLPHGCGGLVISHSGNPPALGEPVTFNLQSTGVRFFLIGFSATPAALCPGCTLGVGLQGHIAVSGSRLALPIPCAGGLVGVTVAVQGGAIGVAGGCTSLGGLALSDTVLLTIR